MISPNNSNKALQVALLVVGENVSAEFAGKMITAAAKSGYLMIKRVYGDTTRLRKWDDAPGFRLIHSGCGKNSADILLSIDAVDLAHASTTDAFAIATSDQDFSHVAHYLRERNFRVVGIGEEKAPAAFRKACTEFIVLPATSIPAANSSTDLDKEIRKLILEAPNRSMPIAEVGPKMFTNFKRKIRTVTSHTTWRAYLLSKPELYRCDPRGDKASVRLETDRT